MVGDLIAFLGHRIKIGCRLESRHFLSRKQYFLMNEANISEPIDPNSPNHCRPADHPAHLPWAPVIPKNYLRRVEKHVKPGETSKKAFHYNIAVEAFGEDYMKRLKKDQENFQGDWFQLAFLLRCHETEFEKRGMDEYERCLCYFCQASLNKFCHPSRKKRKWSDGNDCIHLENACFDGVCLEGVWLYCGNLEGTRLIGTNGQVQGFVGHMRACFLSYCVPRMVGLLHIQKVLLY